MTSLASVEPFGLDITVRRFFCPATKCPRRIFALAAAFPVLPPPMHAPQTAFANPTSPSALLSEEKLGLVCQSSLHGNQP